ncbi:MAG: double zinc ribbon domain-containing protein [Candidatus Saccharicenans sp.]|nr:MAG: hypothetical protein C0168_01105 [Candidatus Aminicenantes bacterium]HEK85721.1 hypothetical protein [Candidatus Aminicenantes bacterium]
MINRKFKIAENHFSRLHKQFLRGELSREQFAEALRNLRLVDDEGRCWMLGAQSGRWYYYDGKNWIQGQPPEDKEGFIVCPACDSLNEPGSRICVNCGAALIKTSSQVVCPECGSLVDRYLETCPQCGATLKIDEDKVSKDELKEKETTLAKPEGSEVWYLRSVDYLSFLLFGGGLGTFIGILIGLISGSTEFWPQLTAYLPDFLKEMQGKLIGGLVFSLVGGIAGFITAAASGFLLAALINASIYFFGCPGLKVEKTKKRFSRGNKV